MAHTLTPRRTQTREKLMDAAVALFAAKGVLGASVEEICERAEFTRGAFYSNFADKDELCLAVLNRQAARELSATQQAVEALRSGVLGASCIEELVDSALSVFMAVQPRTTEDLVTGLELRLYAIRNPAIRPAFLNLNDEMIVQIGELLQSAVERVGARLLVPIEQAIDLLHAVYAHSGSSALLHGLEPDDGPRRQQLAAVLRSLVTEERPAG
ncbi:MAG: TetR/AcrR family transcriptional regulator [Propionibacteriaceae bacterium]|nr:TetR/AcrR family transcriptional regulator [Propionibacteriaceae bacterium]